MDEKKFVLSEKEKNELLLLIKSRSWAGAVNFVNRLEELKDDTA